jgi:hypothetical protein
MIPWNVPFFIVSSCDSLGLSLDETSPLSYRLYFFGAGFGGGLFFICLRSLALPPLPGILLPCTIRQNKVRKSS